MKSNRKHISTGSSFEEEVGYSRAVVDGNWVFVSGTTGFDYSQMTISDNIAEQTEQCFVNINNTLKEAGFKMEDIVRVMYILPNTTDFQYCKPILKKYLGKIQPAATMISAGLADKRMKIEIEVTGKKSDSKA